MLHTYTEANLRAELAEAHEEIRRLKAELHGDAYTRFRVRTLGLTASEAAVLHVLVRGGHATYDQLYDALYADGDKEHEDWNGAARSIVKRLRRRLAPHGISIITIYGEGYRMNEANRAKARELMRGEA